MYQVRPDVQPTKNFYEDENTDPNPEPPAPRSQNKPTNFFFPKYNTTPVEKKKILHSSSKLKEIYSNNKTDTELSIRKYSESPNNFYDTLSEDFLCTLSGVGSHILTSGGKLGQGSLEQISFDNILSPVGGLTLNKMSDSKALVQQEMRAVKFSRHREYLKAFLGLRVWAEVGKRTRQFFFDYIEMQQKKELIDMIFDLKKIVSYRKLTIQHQHQHHQKPQKINYILPASLTNLSYETFTGYETESDDLERNAKQYYKNILAKKTLETLKRRTYYKNLNHKATKFLYYKLLLKYTYKWIDYTKSIPKTITTKRTESTRFYSVPSNNSLYKKSSYTVSSLTDIDEEDPYCQVYKDRLFSKAFHSFILYSNLQKKKKHLQEHLLNCLANRYVTKPFQIWLWLVKRNQVKKRAATQIQQALSQVFLREAFLNIKQAERVVVRIAPKRVPGIILRQGSVPLKERSIFSKNTNTTNLNESSQLQASFRNNNTRERIGLENKENIFKASNNHRPKTQRTFRNYLDGIFPQNKKDIQNSSYQQIPKYTTDTTSISNSIFVMQNMIPQIHTEDTNTSMNMVTLDTSHFGAADKSNIYVEENRYLSRYFDKQSPIRPNKAALEQSFFGLNVSQIDKNENKIIEEDSVHDVSKTESFIIQKQLQSKYYNIQNARKASSNQARHSRNNSSGNAIKSKDINSSFSILHEMKKDERRADFKSRLNRSFEVGTVQSTEEDKKREKSRDLSKEHDNKKSMYKETRSKDSNKFTKMISELQNHLNFLNRNLLNQKLINNKLSHIKGQLSHEKH